MISSRYSDNPIYQAVCFLTYESIRIIESYPDYTAGGIIDYERPQHFFNNKVRGNNTTKWFKRLTEEIENRTYLSLNLRQALYFINNSNKLPWFKKEEEISDVLKEAIKYHEFNQYIDAEAYYSVIKEERDDFAAAMPPPFIQIDYLLSEGQSAYYSLSKMSSGERQLLHSVSSLVYHLKNISSSEPRGTQMAYKNVNLVLEEVELYFHPDYQRRYVRYLLEQIENAHLSPEMAINLIMVTHSPFILSDIPRQNVLFLRNGKPDRSMQEDTFGANIHTLLKNGFFLNTVPIGEFAKDKINKMFAVLNQSDSIPESEMIRLEKEIPLVSEPLLRGQLMKLYAQRKAFAEKLRDEYEARIQVLENMIENLKNQLHD